MEGKAAELAQIAAALHDLCQPLTVLVCRLETGQMQLESPSPMIWAECLEECARLSKSVATMRELVRQAQMGDKGKVEDWIVRGQRT